MALSIGGVEHSECLTELGCRVAREAAWHVPRPTGAVAAQCFFQGGLPDPRLPSLPELYLI